MAEDGINEPSEILQQLVDHGHSPLARYARQLRQEVERERAKAHELHTVQEQLRETVTYVRDLKSQLEQECTRTRVLNATHQQWESAVDRARALEHELEQERKKKEEVNASYKQLRSMIDGVRDVQQQSEQEREKTRELSAEHQKLRVFADDLQVIFEVEQHKNRQLEQAYLNTVEYLIRASLYKDKETNRHLKRLGHYAKALAKCLGVGDDEVALIARAAPMHDVGKVGVASLILGKQGHLDQADWKMMKKHPAIGANLLKGSDSPLLKTARQAALTHHERWDGSGYPQGLKGEQIPLVGRIVMLVDQYDALRSQRPYKLPLEHTKTCDILLNGDGRTLPQHFDPKLLEAFRAAHQDFGNIYRKLQ